MTARQRTSPVRRAGALAVATSVAGVSLVLGASPALAAGSITDPIEGATFDRSTSFTIRATIDTTTATELVLSSPSGASQVVDRGQGTVTNSRAAMSYFFDTSCVSFPSSSCSGSVPGANGTWTISLRGGAQDTRSFVLRIPPAAPSSVSASEQGFRAATVSWRRGSEPDLTGYVLYDNGAVTKDVPLSACSGASCSTTVSYDSDGTGAHAYSLVAKRLAAAGSSSTLSSPRSGEASVNLGSPPPPPPPPPPSQDPSPAPGDSGGGDPSPGPSTGGGTGGSGGSTGGTDSGGGAGGTDSGGSGSGGSNDGGSSTGGDGSTAGGSPRGSTSGITAGTSPATAIAQRRAFGLSFSAFGPKLGIPKLPPLPATQPAVAAPLPDGTFDRSLGYTDVTTREEVSIPQAAVRRVGDAVGLAFDSERFLISLTGALILIAMAAHLRVWLGRPPE